MDAKYQTFKIKGKKFVVKLDFNPIAKEYDYHMYISDVLEKYAAMAC